MNDRDWDLLEAIWRKWEQRAWSGTIEPLADLPAAVPSMDCGHPLSARRIIADLTRLPEGFRTDCWACAVQREVVSRIVGPKAVKRRDGAA